MTAGGPLPKTPVRTRINAVNNISISLAIRLFLFIIHKISLVISETIIYCFVLTNHTFIQMVKKIIVYTLS